MVTYANALISEANFSHRLDQSGTTKDAPAIDEKPADLRGLVDALRAWFAETGGGVVMLKIVPSPQGPLSGGIVQKIWVKVFG